MYLCLDNGRLFVTNSDHATLKLQAKRNPGFHFEPIDYAEVEVSHPLRRSEAQRLRIEELAAESRRKPPLLPKLTPEQQRRFDHHLNQLLEEL